MTGRPTPDDLVRLHAAGAQVADPAARVTLAEWDRQDAALRTIYGSIADEPLPERFRSILADAALAPPARGWGLLARIAASVALLALAGGAGWLAGRATAPAPSAVQFEADALRAHATFVVEVAHPVEVGAGDAAHLVAWLSKRLGRPITPPDFAAEGFRLMGGRVLPDPAGPAAQMMYEDDLGHRLTLYVALNHNGRETAFQFAEAGATQSFYWLDGPLACAITGDLPRELLRKIAVAAYGQLT